MYILNRNDFKMFNKMFNVLFVVHSNLIKDQSNADAGKIKNDLQIRL